VRVFEHDMVKTSMLDLNCRSFGRGYLCNRTVMSELIVHCQSSHHDLVRGSASCHPALATAHCQLLECTCIATLMLSGVSCNHPSLLRAHLQLKQSACIVNIIISVATHAFSQVLYNATVSIQSLHIYAQWYCWRLLMSSLWSCWSPQSDL